MERRLLLDAGSGGLASQRLINDIFFRYFKNDILQQMDDAALLSPPEGHLAMSTDSYTVTPLFFPGGSIGTLAVNGTVNDVAMLGAKPLWLACGFILEEGLSLGVLERVVSDMAKSLREADVKIVTGDTKVVPQGACDKIFINTTGIGAIYARHVPSGHKACPGDAIIVSGTVGDHGLAIMAARDDVAFLSGVKSDCAPLAAMIEEVIQAAGSVHVLRDPTRGGLATTLNEIAQQSNVGIEISEDSVPIGEEVAGGCSFLGIDPLYLANEGKVICILPAEKADAALAVMRKSPHGKNASIVGKVTQERPGHVILNTCIGGQRFLGMLEGAQLPRIC